MGYYINPPNMSKDDFLASEGTEITTEEAAAFDYSDTDTLPVCLVDNGLFTAAAIAYNKQERDYFLEPDPRAMRWFLVKKVLLDPYLQGC